MALTLEALSYRILSQVAPGRALSDREWTTLMRAAETFLLGCPVRIAADQVADNVEHFLIEGRSRRAFRVRVLLTLLEYLPVPYYGVPFSALSEDRRLQLVRDKLMTGAHLWGVCAKVRLLLLMGAYGDGRAMNDLGLVPPADRVRSQLATTPARSTLIQLQTRPGQHAH